VSDDAHRFTLGQGRNYRNLLCGKGGGATLAFEERYSTKYDAQLEARVGCEPSNQLPKNSSNLLIRQAARLQTIHVANPPCEPFATPAASLPVGINPQVGRKRE
jgi:hypothetical protein